MIEPNDQDPPYSDGPIDNPTIKRYDAPTLNQLLPLQSSTVDVEMLEKVRAVLAGELDPCEASPACAAWVASCYNKPDPDGHDCRLEACNDLLGMSGVVALNIEGAETYTDEGIRMCPPFSYCNAGDTYEITLARDHENGQWVIASWGDLLEEYEIEHELGAYATFEEKPDQCPECDCASLELHHYTGSARGDSYSWVCVSCSHHVFAVMGFDPEGEIVTYCDMTCAKCGMTCAKCGKVILESKSWGLGDVGDSIMPSYCSKECYESAEWDRPGDDDGDIAGTGDEK